MTLSEVGLLIEMHTGEEQPRYAGRLRERDLKEIDEWMAEMEERDAHEPA